MKTRLWAGYYGGEIDWNVVSDTEGVHYALALFCSRAEARRQYTDVREIKVVEAKRRKKQKRKPNG